MSEAKDISGGHSGGDSILAAGSPWLRVWLQWGFAGLFALVALYLGHTYVQQAREDRSLFREEIRRQQINSDRQWESIRANQENLRRVTEAVERMSEIQLRQMKRDNP